MPRSRIQRIREKVRLRQYDMSAHAMEEMAEYGLDRMLSKPFSTGALPELKEMMQEGPNMLCKELAQMGLLPSRVLVVSPALDAI